MRYALAPLFLFLGMASTLVLIFGPLVTIIGLALVVGRLKNQQVPEAIVTNLAMFLLGNFLMTAGDPDAHTVLVALFSAATFIGICSYLKAAQ